MCPIRSVFPIVSESKFDEKDISFEELKLGK